mmetsp:Transcript_6365/g.23972  ORF Transcript_6365/g.23972 Transcript_6365/m.23972 type:complete len:263 (+) Transcript_6365:1147-1935(+)
MAPSTLMSNVDPSSTRMLESALEVMTPPSSVKMTPFSVVRTALFNSMLAPSEVLCAKVAPIAKSADTKSCALFVNGSPSLEAVFNVSCPLFTIEPDPETDTAANTAEPPASMLVFPFRTKFAEFCCSHFPRITIFLFDSKFSLPEHLKTPPFWMRRVPLPSSRPEFQVKVPNTSMSFSFERSPSRTSSPSILAIKLDDTEDIPFTLRVDPEATTKVAAAPALASLSGRSPVASNPARSSMILLPPRVKVTAGLMRIRASPFT